MFAVQETLAHKQVDRLADGRPADGINGLQLALGGDGLVRLELTVGNALAQYIRQLVITRQKIVGVNHIGHQASFEQ
jgi:hypothetical protein